jgi:hypothetical protein
MNGEIVAVGLAILDVGYTYGKTPGKPEANLSEPSPSRPVFRP